MTNYTLGNKYDLIQKKVLSSSSKDPVVIAKLAMHEPYVSLHGPEHHFLDGAAFLVAYHNAGGKIDIEKALCSLAERTVMMPGAMCGYWGVCGSVASVGAALSIINDTGPLSSDEHYKENMEFTSSVLKKMSVIGGPRCCKRNAFLSLQMAVAFVKEKWGIEMECDHIICEFSSLNLQCIGPRCPFHSK
ncbi:MAG: DUF5714 domain-containing protein [Bacilli bacterium]|jgi:hypothetical protein